MASDDVYVLGIDQSTQGTKALLFDAQGKLIEKATLPHRQIIDERGYVEHDLNEIGANVIGVVKALIDKDPVRADKIATVGLSVQRETVAAWRRSTLEPLYNAVVWQCARGAEFVSKPEVKSKAQRIREITGLELSEYFSAAKITWLVDNVPEVRECAQKNDLCIGNMDAFLISYLTHGQSFATEPSNASRTQLMDLKNLCWSEELCSLFKVPLTALPEIKDSDSEFGFTDFNGLLKHQIPIHAAVGDSQGALFGHGCSQPGQVKTTYGTGSSIMMNSGDKVSSCEHGIVNSVGWRRHGRTTYVLEGNINYSAGIISYLKDDMQLIADPAETEALARAANPNDRCYFVPALSGLGAPYFNGNVRGSILGISRLTGKKEIVRAALDSIAYQVNDILALIRKSSDVEVTQLCVDGGATKNSYLMQFQSDLVGLPLKVPSDAELSGKGAAFMAAIAQGIYSESILEQHQEESFFRPLADEKEIKTKVEGWHKAIASTIDYGI
ncbi:glycerol kinase [Succinivibrio dextrinosolvens]|uniref:FGGY-family carbohydrate kinase n=1 Tax=Succinivibrio dextrinosolvens TaxID=83771 RepID=UPI0008E615F6|nr:glycerol kinase GlpK [Succinivibrio dextrinosolvens]SFS43419.1 glycerol kinase [Succinivibrio dextrinosolvens]